MDPLKDGSIPNWVMLGIFHGDRYYIYASDDLTEVDLPNEHRNRQSDFADFAAAATFPRDTHYTRLTMKFGTYHLGIGYSYSEALRNLMLHWNPDDKKVKEIGQ